MATHVLRRAAAAAALPCACALALATAGGANAGATSANAGGASKKAGAASTNGGATSAQAGGESEAALLASLLRSRELWATIDVCDPPDQRDTVGVRGSMPGDRHAGDTLWMSFRLQYMNTSKQWVDLASAATKPIAVGPGNDPVRQAGRSFKLVPKTGQAASTLRGLVEYQWRRGKRVLQSTSRTTGAGHASRAGADPAGYSAAECAIS